MEIKTVLFAYQKKAFPLSQIYNDMEELFEQFDRQVKILDIPSIVAQLLDIPIPFSNMGVFHPLLAPYSDLSDTYSAYLRNLQ